MKCNINKTCFLYLINNTKFLDLLLYRASAFGKLRFINTKNNLKINFEEHFSPWKFINHINWQLNESALLNEFARQSNMTITQVEALYSSVQTVPVWNLVQGHDTVNILAIAFKNVIKGHRNRVAEDICSDLRLAYDSRIFAASVFYKKICRWEISVTQTILKEL